MRETREIFGAPFQLQRLRNQPTNPCVSASCWVDIRQSEGFITASGFFFSLFCMMHHCLIISLNCFSIYDGNFLIHCKLDKRWMKLLHSFIYQTKTCKISFSYLQKRFSSFHWMLLFYFHRTKFILRTMIFLAVSLRSFHFLIS